MNNKMVITDEENVTGEYLVFCTFDSGLTGKSYVVYTNELKDKDNMMLLLSGSYKKVARNHLRVDKRLTHEEKVMLEKMVQIIIDQSKAKEMDDEDSID